MTQEDQSGTTRREFLKHSARLGGGAVIVRYLADPTAACAAPSAATKGAPSATHWLSPSGRAAHRYDGLAKVTGAKIYGRDFRARDLPGWPGTEHRVHILRSPSADKVLVGVDESKLRAELGVSRILTGEQLTAWGVAAGGPFFMPTVLVPAKSVPFYLGQPVALLFFDSGEAYLAAKPKLIDTAAYVTFGEAGAPAKRDPFGTSRFVRYGDASGKEEFSFVKDGPWAPPWEPADPAGSPNAKASHYIQLIQKDLETKGWKTLTGSYATQGVDPVFMEPECGLAWYDPKTKVLALTLSTQSPHDDGEAILHMFAKSSQIKVEQVVINCCYPGGGFGGRDSSDFPLYLALAAVAEPGVTQRIVSSRFDQFQGGLKRHPAQIDVELAFDADGKFQALHSTLTLDGGGQNNYSFAIQNVGARNATSGYAFPRSWVDSVANPSIAVPAGSMRGFGSFQSSFALECLIDEAAGALGMDPIDLRLKNVLTDPQPVHTGALPIERINSDVLLQKARSCELWAERSKVKAARQTGSKLYGVGMALAVKSFGKNPGDTCLAGLSFDKEGRLHLHTNAVDMGNGSATTLPLAVADVLGRPADTVSLGVTKEFAALGVVGPKAKDEADQAKLAANPFWVPSLSMSMAASASSFQMRHAVLESAKALLHLGIWPAAVALWRLTGDDRRLAPEALKWVEGGLAYKDRKPLPFAQLAAKAHELDLPTGAMVHSFYRSRWARASFPTRPDAPYESEIDALALRKGSGKFEPVARTSVDFPPYRTGLAGANRYTPYAVVVAVEVDRATGEVQVVGAETFLDCGAVLQKELVEGQMEGAFAMGIGQALLESYPTTLDGPGQGGWNLHRYQVAKSKDCAISRTRFNILPAAPGTPPKGMAEVVFNGVPAAIANAVADATGKRFKKLPIRPEDVKAALA